MLQDGTRRYIRGHRAGRPEGRGRRQRRGVFFGRELFTVDKKEMTEVVRRMMAAPSCCAETRAASQVLIIRVKKQVRSVI